MLCRGATKLLLSRLVVWTLCAGVTPFLAASAWFAPSAALAQSESFAQSESPVPLADAVVLDRSAAVDTPMVWENSDATVGSWTAEMVRAWAAECADGARALQAESRSVGAAYDRDKSEQRQQACMTQTVLAHLAAHDRNRAAAEALSTYYQIVAIEQQLSTLRDAIEVVDTLTQLAEKAEQFELPDGDPNALQQQGLELAARVVDAEVGIRKLRLRLARLTGRPLSVANEVLLSDPIPPALVMLSLDDALADALVHRRDLQAIEAVCPCISSDTMPAVRSLMGVLQPGLGIGTAIATKSLLFAHGGEEGKDVCARREQCRALAHTRRGQIQDEVRLAEMELQACYQRTELADRRLTLAKQAAREQVKAVELEQSPPGSDLLAALESLTVRGDLQSRLMEQSLAEVELLEARGAAHRE